MFGSRVQDPRRQHATFLLPSFPGFLPRPKRAASTAEPPTQPHDRPSLPATRTSVALAVSAAASVRMSSESGSSGSVGSGSTGSSPPTSTLCTSPENQLSCSASASASPVAALAAARTAEPDMPAAAAAAAAERRSGDHHRRRRRRLARVHPDTLRCRRCAADLAFADQIVSKGFTGRHGRAYLVSPPAARPGHRFAPGVPPGDFPVVPGDDDAAADDNLVDDNEAAARAFDRARFRDDAGDAPLANVCVGRPETRQLLTGAHVVADMTCAQCGARLGWKYVDARDAAQRYKVGKFIVDVARLSVFRSWEDVGGEDEDEDEDEDDDDYSDDDDDDDDDDAPIEFDSGDEDECEEIFAGTWDAATVAARRRQRATRVNCG